MPDLKEALASVMSGREERAATQSRLLAGGGFVCQISLNVPGFPKRLDGDAVILEKFAADLVEKICCQPLGKVQLENGAGLALLMLFDGGSGKARDAKLAGIAIEESGAYGRIADIDVITEDGPLSRADLGYAPRRCVICGGLSKECARERRHTYEELRAKMSFLMDIFFAKHE